MENNTSHLRWNTVECVYSRICIYHVCNETKALPEAKEQQPLRIANGLLHIPNLQWPFLPIFLNSPKATRFSTYALLAIQCLELHNTYCLTLKIKLKSLFSQLCERSELRIFSKKKSISTILANFGAKIQNVTEISNDKKAFF